MGRAPCCDKASVKKGPWSPEEDAKLKAYIEQYGTGGNWIALPQKIGLKRCGKSCRLRWLNYLRPNIKHGGFSEEEDNLICSLYISIGSRWSIIAAQLPGRTDNDIKNYWNTKLKKKLLGKRKQSNINRPSLAGPDRAEDSSSSSPQALSNSALERLQLHMQLQNLHNPFSFHDNLSLWPKLHPFQEKMLFQSLGERSSSPHMQHVLPGSQHEGGQKIDIYEQVSGNSLGFQQDYPKFDTPSADGSQNPLNVLASSGGSIPCSNGNNVMDSYVISRTDAVEESGGAIQSVSTLQAELEALLNNKTSAFMAQENQIADFDCFKETNVSKDRLMWWSNEFETNSASSNSWNSEEIFQDCELGCNL